MFVFNAKDLIPVINEARKKKCPILLVKDQGVYFISEKRDQNPDEKCKNIAYAQGCNPDVDDFDNWWNKARNELGGDDFAQSFDSGAKCFSFVLQKKCDLYVEAEKNCFKVGYLV